MPFAPVINVMTDSNPCPRAEVLFASFAAGTATVTVYRLADGREFPVRSAVRTPVAGALTRVDFEIPFGVPVTYRAEMIDAAGLPLGFTDTTEVTVPVLDTWVHNPLTPAGAVSVSFRGKSLRDLQRPVDGATFYPLQRAVGVIVSGQRRGLRAMTLDVVTESQDAADRFQALAGGYLNTTVPVMCVRIGAADRLRIPRPLFASVLNIREQDIDYVIGGEKIAHAVEGDEVAPPAEALIVPLLTRADVNAFYSTRAAAKAANLTRLALNRRYELAGTA